MMNVAQKMVTACDIELYDGKNMIGVVRQRRKNGEIAWHGLPDTKWAMKHVGEMFKVEGWYSKEDCIEDLVDLYKSYVYPELKKI